jgi:hypothetical protein
MFQDVRRIGVLELLHAGASEHRNGAEMSEEFGGPVDQKV